MSSHKDGERTQTTWGPYTPFLYAGWACIPLFGFRAGAEVRLTPPPGYRARKAAFTFRDLELLEKSSGFSPLQMRLRPLAGLGAFAAHHFLDETPVHHTMHLTYVEAALPADMCVQAADGPVEAHADILACRCARLRDGRAPVLPFSRELVRRALYYLYTGDIRRLAGWFEAGDRALFHAAPHARVLEQVAPRGREALFRALMAGALPFHDIALALGAASLRAACVDHLIHGLKELRGSLEARLYEAALDALSVDATGYALARFYDYAYAPSTVADLTPHEAKVFEPVLREEAGKNATPLLRQCMLHVRMPPELDACKDLQPVRSWVNDITSQIRSEDDMAAEWYVSAKGWRERLRAERELRVRLRPELIPFGAFAAAACEGVVSSLKQIQSETEQRSLHIPAVISVQMPSGPQKVRSFDLILADSFAPLCAPVSKNKTI